MGSEGRDDFVVAVADVLPGRLTKVKRVAWRAGTAWCHVAWRGSTPLESKGHKAFSPTGADSRGIMPQQRTCFRAVSQVGPFPVLFVAVLSVFGLSQLPPEIQADRLMVQVDRLVTMGDHELALAGVGLAGRNR